MIIDLHIHTSWGSPDSTLSPKQLVAEARRLGLHGVCLTEHNRGWDRYEFQELAQNSGVVLLRGIEVGTEMGHLVVFGLDGYVSGIHRARELRRVVDREGGFIIAAHPFRYYFDPHYHFDTLQNPEEMEAATRLSVFEVADAIEVINGQCTPRENFLALQVAKKLGFRGTGGSDAHSTQGLGCFTTVFEKEIKDGEDLIRELKAGRFYPAQGLLDGKLEAYGDGVAGPDLGLQS